MRFLQKLFGKSKQPSRFAGRKRRVFVEDTTLSMTLCFQLDENEQITSVSIGDRLITLDYLRSREQNLLILGHNREAHKIRFGKLGNASIT